MGEPAELGGAVAPDGGRQVLENVHALVGQVRAEAVLNGGENHGALALVGGAEGVEAVGPSDKPLLFREARADDLDGALDERLI